MIGVLIGETQECARLRSLTPFPGVLTAEQRDGIFRRWREYDGPGQGEKLEELAPGLPLLKVRAAIAAKDQKTVDTLSAYSSGKVPRGVAMRRLGLSWYGDLIQALAFSGLRLPAVSNEYRRTMATAFVKAVNGKKFRIAIPDAGVLISLASGQLLDLLVTFRPSNEVVIPDVVAYQVTRRIDTANAAEIRRFLSRQAGHIVIDETSYAPLLRAARNDTSIPIPEELGDSSIYSYLNTIKRWNPGQPTLVLVEDNWFVENDIANPAHAHFLSTTAFLEGLESLVPNFSAKMEMEAICNARPHRYFDDELSEDLRNFDEWSKK